MALAAPSKAPVTPPRCMTIHSVSLAKLASHLAHRRGDVLQAWRQAIAADPELRTGASLPRSQLNDHIPALLEDFERRLTSRGVGERHQAEDAQQGNATAHGLLRWQQGFDLAEVVRELGRLNECVVIELERYAALDHAPDSASDSAPASATMAEARSIWARLCGVAIDASTSEYFRLRQLETASHVGELESALASLQKLETQQAELWRQAAHDLRGNLGVVVTATAGLASQKSSPDARATFLGVLERNVRALHRLLEDVTRLARLQGGLEHRSLAPLDASILMREVCESLQPLADERAIFLHSEGPPHCEVEGDEIKIRRIVQNLVVNSIKYTRRGGVSMTWGHDPVDDTSRWFIQIRDTGPGFHAGPGSKIVEALAVATELAKEVAADASSGDVAHASGDLTAAQIPEDDRPVHQQPGEGLGLSIVKRLCELLDASFELDSQIGVGTTFRILLPWQYGSP